MQQNEHTDKPEFEADSQSLPARSVGLKLLISLILRTISLLPIPARAQPPVGETAQEPVVVDAAPAWVEPRDLSIEWNSLGRMMSFLSGSS
jgi:hypothetical protein